MALAARIHDTTASPGLPATRERVDAAASPNEHDGDAEQHEAAVERILMRDRRRERHEQRAGAHHGRRGLPAAERDQSGAGAERHCDVEPRPPPEPGGGRVRTGA
jgi:hypothetical protein